MDIKQFLNTSYTAYHAVKNAKTMLDESGFVALDNDGKWALERGGKYYIIKNDSAIVAFVIGDLTNYVFKIAGSHSDSPCLKVKGDKLIDSEQGKRINVEEYGGFLRYSMLDTPLKIAGRVAYEKDGKIETQLVDSPYFVSIPSLAIHHNQTANSALELKIFPDMLPIIGNCESLYSTLAPDVDVIDADLYCVNAQTAFESGVNGEYLSSPRIDNLTSVYSSIVALIGAKPNGIALACCFDNEEIGSSTKQGANGVFLQNVLERINLSLGYDKADYINACANGFVLSIDNGHASHPAHPEKSDVTEKTKLNGGIVIKHHTNYATDGLSSAKVKNMLKKANVPYQDYYNNSNLRCGSTIGLMVSAKLEMEACDIGLAQLAMHSATEMVGKHDIERMQKCVSAFFNGEI